MRRNSGYLVGCCGAAFAVASFVIGLEVSSTTAAPSVEQPAPAVNRTLKSDRMPVLPAKSRNAVNGPLEIKSLRRRPSPCAGRVRAGRQRDRSAAALARSRDAACPDCVAGLRAAHPLSLSGPPPNSETPAAARSTVRARVFAGSDACTDRAPWPEGAALTVRSGQWREPLKSRAIAQVASNVDFPQPKLARRVDRTPGSITHGRERVRAA